MLRHPLGGREFDFRAVVVVLAKDRSPSRASNVRVTRAHELIVYRGVPVGKIATLGRGDLAPREWRAFKSCLGCAAFRREWAVTAAKSGRRLAARYRTLAAAYSR